MQLINQVLFFYVLLIRNQHIITDGIYLKYEVLINKMHYNTNTIYILDIEKKMEQVLSAPLLLSVKALLSW